jgi:hypothetical protein
MKGGRKIKEGRKEGNHSIKEGTKEGKMEEGREGRKEPSNVRIAVSGAVAQNEHVEFPEEGREGRERLFHQGVRRPRRLQVLKNGFSKK